MYRSPYEAYPFLSDCEEDLRCDFELATDRLASLCGCLRSLCKEEEIIIELERITELIYHLNPSLRTFCSLEDKEVDFLAERTKALSKEVEHRFENFVLPQGSTRATTAHLLRVDAKSLVRLLYFYEERGGVVQEKIYDFANLLSNYFFYFALKLNELDGVQEIHYESRNYYK